MNKTALIMAGGTGGHIYPAVAVAEALVAAGYDIVWLGSEYGMEGEVVPSLGYTFCALPVTAWHGKAIRKLTAPINFLRALWRCFAVFKKHQPVITIGFGGYPSAPGGVASVFTRTPLVLHEQNGVPGLTNRFLAKYARALLQAFPNTFPEQIKAQVVGNPVRSAIAAIQQPLLRKPAVTNTPLKILVLGGSQGALAINELVPKAIAMLSEKIELLHQTGKGNADKVREQYKDNHQSVQVSDYIEDMASAYAWADLAIARSGASTVSELAAAGVPALLIPYPWHKDKQQYRNADWLSEANVAETFEQRTLTADQLAERIKYWCDHRNELLARAEQTWHLGVRDASDKIVNVINAVVEGKYHD